MIKVSLEVREGATFSRVAVRADTISRAVSITQGSNPGRDVRVVFPIEPEGFFARDPEKTTENTKNGSQIRQA